MPNQLNSGALFKNDRRETDRHPAYTGSINVDGRDYFIDAWLNTSRDGQTKFMGLKVKLKDQQSGGAVRTTNAAPATAPGAAPSAAPATAPGAAPGAAPAAAPGAAPSGLDFSAMEQAFGGQAPAAAPAGVEDDIPF